MSAVRRAAAGAHLEERWRASQGLPAPRAPALWPTLRPCVLHARSLADFVLPEALRVRGYDDVAEEAEVEELEFSDDEAVS